MQDKEADMLLEKQARLAQQGVQRASNKPAGKPKEAEAQKATSKELQQAEVSAVSKRKCKRRLDCLSRVHERGLWSSEDSLWLTSM